MSVVRPLGPPRVWWMTTSTKAVAITGELTVLVGSFMSAVGRALQDYARARFMAYVEEARSELRGATPAAPDRQQDELRDAQHGGGEPLEPYDEEAVAAGVDTGRGDR